MAKTVYERFTREGLTLHRRLNEADIHNSWGLRLREALAKWKCDRCEAEPWATYCSKCDGNGLHPIAPAALEDKTNG